MAKPIDHQRVTKEWAVHLRRIGKRIANRKLRRTHKPLLRRAEYAREVA